METKDFDVKKEYNKLKLIYKQLPDFEEVERDFEITAIEKGDLFSKRLRRRLVDKIVFFCKIIENLIYPSLQNPLSAYEASFFNDEERQEMGALHKQLMIFERKSLILDVEGSDEDKDIDFVMGLFGKWENFKKELSKIVNKMSESWQKDLEDDGERYFG